MPRVSIFDDPVMASILGGSYLRGATLYDLASDFGVSHVTVMNVLRKNGFERPVGWRSTRRSEKFKVSIVVYAYAHGVSLSAISRWVGAVPPHVSHHLKPFREASRAHRELLLKLSRVQLEAWAEATDVMGLPYMDALELAIEAGPGATMPVMPRRRTVDALNDPLLFQMMLGAHRAGATIMEVSQDWGVDVRALRARFQALGEPPRWGIKPRRFKKSLILYAIAMGAKGSEIAKFLGVPRQHVHYQTRKRKGEWFDGVDAAILASLSAKQLDVWANSVDVDMMPPVTALRIALDSPKGRRE